MYIFNKNNKPQGIKNLWFIFALGKNHEALLFL